MSLCSEWEVGKLRSSYFWYVLKSLFWLIDHFFHVIIENFRHSAPFVMKEYMLKKLQTSAVFLSTLYLTLQFRKHPNENLASHKAQCFQWSESVQIIRNSYFWYFKLLLVQNVANIWPIDNPHPFLTFNPFIIKKITSELGGNWAFLENLHFY